ncbi:MAG: hypothetical protein WCO67_25080 [Betaproteobacteria bacterium]
MKKPKRSKEMRLGSGCKGFSLLQLQIWIGSVFLAVFVHATAGIYAVTYSAADCPDSSVEVPVSVADASQCPVYLTSAGAK